MILRSRYKVVVAKSRREQIDYCSAYEHVRREIRFLPPPSDLPAIEVPSRNFVLKTGMWNSFEPFVLEE